jgi:hypothetical protein
MAGYYSYKAVAAVLSILLVIWLVYAWSRDRVQDSRLYAEAFVMGAFAVVVARIFGLLSTWIVQGSVYVAPAQNYAIPGNWLDFFRIILNGTFTQLILAMLVGGAAAVLVTYIAALMEATDEDEDDEHDIAELESSEVETVEIEAIELETVELITDDRDDEKRDEKSSKSVKAAPTPVENGTDLQELQGMTSQFIDKLKDNGVMSIEDLIEQAGNSSERKSLAQNSGISRSRILRWVNMADLMRIPGVSANAADLLEKAGVDSVVELGVRSPERLLAKLENTNKSEKIMESVPELDIIQKWVERAKELPRKVTHDSGVKK